MCRVSRFASFPLHTPPTRLAQRPEEPWNGGAEPRAFGPPPHAAGRVDDEWRDRGAGRNAEGDEEATEEPDDGTRDNRTKEVRSIGGMDSVKLLTL